MSDSIQNTEVISSSEDGVEEHQFYYQNRPSVFISYKYNEETFSSEQNERHRAWVVWLASYLKENGFNVVWDNVIRDVMPITEGAFQLWAEICRLCVLRCHVFLPVITPGYLTRMGWENGIQQNSFDPGVIYEEISQYRIMAPACGMALAPVFRSLKIENSQCKIPSLFYNDGNYFSLLEEFDDKKPEQMELLRRWIIHSHSKATVPFEMTLRGMIQMYIAWCRGSYPERQTAPIEEWIFSRSCPVEFMNSLRKHP